MKVGDLVKWGGIDSDAAADVGIIAAIGSGAGAGLAYVEWFLTPAHSGYIPIEEEMLKVINEL